MRKMRCPNCTKILNEPERDFNIPESIFQADKLFPIHFVVILNNIYICEHCNIKVITIESKNYKGV